MLVAPAREVAYRILQRLESGRGFAVDLFQSPEVNELKEADVRLVNELVMGVLRWRGELDFQIERLSGKPLSRLDPEVVTILRLGIYQIRFLARIPKPAVVNEAVELTKAARKRSAAGLVNAVLRKCVPPAQRIAARRFEELNPESMESIRRAVPAWMFARWAARDIARDLAGEMPGRKGRAESAVERGPQSAQEQHRRPEAAATVAALRLAWASIQVPPTTLRVVSEADDRESLRRDLAEEGMVVRAGRFASRALVVESGAVLSSKALRAGRVVIQDEASQLVAELLALEPGQCVLDLCAAPGIKAGQLAQALGRGTLVVCDLSPKRLRTMLKLLASMIPTNVRLNVVRLDATRELPFRGHFDRILLDAPCSGTGTLARNPEIKWRLHPSDLPRLAEPQTKMLRNALRHLAPGGRLVYATCSLEPEENEQVVEGVLAEAQGCRLLGAQELAREFPALSALFDSQGYFRTRPDLHQMDGFFAAVIVRVG